MRAVDVLLVARPDAGAERLADRVRGAPGLELAGVASTLEDAVRLAAREAPRVALLVAPSPAEGATMARALHDAAPVTRIVALAGEADRAGVLGMLQAGAVSYLLDTSPDERVLETLRRTGRGHARLATEVTDGVVVELVSQLEAQADVEREHRDKLERIEQVLRMDALSVCFQALLDLGSGEILGYEALARFRADGARPPDHWFREAAEIGLDVELELAAVRSALRHVDRLPPDAWLMLNVSPSIALMRELDGVLRAAPADRIVLEVTEHAPIADYDEFNAAVAGLRSAGVRLAVDDAGAGFASLRHILRLAPDVIKLDAELTRGIDADPVRRALGAALMTFADDVGARMVAEGIETPGELRTLREMGVRLGQGFYLSRPEVLEAAR
ncbi:MAG TPA: EAL domain-containing protein [Solirubrobacteraceae bacterium]|nr:EAL domain-containing protein [Solirubrobacteraceae bacterium]